MKKALLSTSAIALMGAMTSANAADWEMNLGGYMEQQIGYVSQDSAAGTSTDGVHQFSDQEFYVRPRIVLDNGIRIAARMDFEGQSGGGVDEPHIRVAGSFGTLTLGEDDDAAGDVVVAAPEVDFMGIVSGSEVHYIFGGGSLVPQDGFSNGPYTNLGGDAMQIKYFTPRFAGFQVGASYSRDGKQSQQKGIQDINNPGRVGNGNSDIASIGANYTNSFGGFDISAGAGWSTAGDNTPGSPQAWNAGAAVGYAGFSIGGGFAEGNDTGDDGRSYNAGLAYRTGPWGFSFTYTHGESSDQGGLQDKNDQYKLAVNYDLAKGVRIHGIGMYFDEDDASTTAKRAAPGAGDIDGWVIGTGLRVDF